MKFINVLEGFKLNLADGMREIAAGIQEVEDEIAAHWFVAANSKPLTAKQAKAMQADDSPDPEPEVPADPDLAPTPDPVDPPTETPPAS